MHIVYVSREYLPSLRGGGIASYVKEIAEQLVIRGHQVTVISASDHTQKESDEKINGVRIIRLSGGDFVICGVEPHRLIRKFRPLYRYYTYRKKIRKIIESLSNVDIVEVADFGGEALFLDGLNIPLTIRMHGPSLLNRDGENLVSLNFRNFWKYKLAQKELDIVRRCSYITACSMSMKKWTQEYAGVSDKHIRVLYNPINKEDFINDIEEHIFNRMNLNIVFVGTICVFKGCEELINACRQLKCKYPSLTLWLFGKKGVWAQHLELENKKNSWAIFYGKVEREKLYSIYKHSTIVCLPSWWDNFPMTCLEAMSAGAIVIGGKSGGMSEIIQDGVNGFLCEPKNTESLVTNIEKALCLSKEEVVMMKANAIRTIDTHFSSDVIIPQMEEYYQQVIADYRKKNYEGT